ncbi:hypothetical protein LCGC14_1530580 [marine sediment metagenome]|uniref:Uncharacterized protein n=1 Tax=marine sediment metagenome TaxID=412755 RepID=A0A0F9LBQ6_9ZZZZ
MNEALQKEQARLRKQRQRDRERDILERDIENVTGEGRIQFIQKELNDPYLIEEIEGAAALFKDRELRYERAYRYKLWKDGKPVPLTDKDTAAKLLQVCNALDKTVTGLDGKKVNLLSMVRYGVNGPTLTTVSEMLRADSRPIKE